MGSRPTKTPVEKKRADAGTLLEYLYALNRTADSPTEVQSQLDKALDLVRAGGDKDVKRRVFVSRNEDLSQECREDAPACL